MLALLTEKYKASGISETIKLYHTLKAENYYNNYFYNENTLLNPAYELLNNNLVEDALQLFILNAEEYRFAPNAFDSLAEAYLKKGDREQAISNYKKALSIDPNFESSKKALAELVK